MNRAVFFDRDGVINARLEGAYVRNWDEFQFLEEAGQVLQEVRQRGYKAILVTNQRGVGRGIMTEEELLKLHGRMQEHLLEEFQAQFDDIYYCTDATDDSGRRKPSPAMLLEAAEKWQLDLSHSWMVGDSPTDVEAGRRAGTQTAFLVTNFTISIPQATVVLHSLPELLEYL